MQRLRTTAQEAWESLVGLSNQASRERWPDVAVRAITNAKQRVNFIVAELNGMVNCEGAARIAAKNEQTALKPVPEPSRTETQMPAEEKRVASRKHPAHQARDRKSAAAGDFEDDEPENVSAIVQTPPVDRQLDLFQLEPGRAA